MGKIGYTVKTDTKEESKYLKSVQGCAEVIITDDYQDNYIQFDEFLRRYKDNHLIVVNFESIGLQLSQMTPVFNLLEEEGIKLHFVEKPVATDQAYIHILKSLAHSEKEIVSRRTLKGLRVAHAKGVVSGRPKTDDKIVSKIKYLHRHQKKNIRQISVECGVSLGTVHKYINLADEG